MQQKKSQKRFRIVLVYLNDMTRTVSVKASDRETAERRALKHNPAAISIRRAM